MEPDESPLPPCPRTGQCFLRELVRRGCRSDSLGKIATPVVTLDEHPSRIPESRRQPSVPYVRDEEGNVTCLGHDRYGGAALPLQIVVGEPLQGRCLSRHVASRDHPRRSSFGRAVPEIEVSRYGEDRVRDPCIPRNARVTRHVGSAVDVPEASEMSVVARFLSPRRIGDHVTVFSQEGLNDLEDPGVADSPLDKAAPIEHLVTKWGGLLGRISSLVWRIFLENPFDIGAEPRELFSLEDAIENYVSL